MPQLDADAIARAADFHSWDAMAPAALREIAARGPFAATAETGCGGSTIVLSQLSAQHTAFAIEGENRTITALRGRPDFAGGHVTFVEGETKYTVPAHRASVPLDLLLLDGPHAYPLPQIEYAYLFPQLKSGGWLVMDDIQIPSVHELFRFLRAEPGIQLEKVAVRTAFFRKVADVADSPDPWPSQGINRRPIWQYAWKDQLRGLLKLR